MNILHLSDLHFGTVSDAKNWYSQLAEDLKHGLSCKKIDIMIISGDIANKAIISEYDAAKIFIEKVCEKFSVDRSSVVIVPGNHDLNWNLSKAGYNREKRKEKNIYAEGLYYKENCSVLCLKQPKLFIRHDDEYKKRFSPFSKFYQDIKGEPYPLESENQGMLHYFSNEFKILILGLNSSWTVDHHFKNRACICPDAISKAIDTIEENSNYSDCLKIAVWHHPLVSPFEDRITDHGFMERLAKNGFKVCIHGHLHKADRGLFRYEHSEDGRKVEIVGAGTFGAPSKEWYPGCPLQYNLLRVSENDITVETRCRDEINGAWKPDARWLSGPKKDPLPRYVINLFQNETNDSKSLTNEQTFSEKTHSEIIETAKRPAKILLNNAKDRWSFPDDDFPLRFEEKKSGPDKTDSEFCHLRPDDLMEKIREGGNLLLVGKAGAGKTTTLISLAEKMIEDLNFPLPVFIDAVNWALTDKSILHYLTDLPAFVDTGLSAKHLTSLSEKGRFVLVLNGWNEISPQKKDEARGRLQDYISGSTSARLIISTRSEQDIAIIPNSSIVIVHGFDWQVQQAYVHKRLPPDKAEDVLSQLRNNTKLRSVTQNPMALRGAVSLYHQGQNMTSVIYDLYDGIIKNYEEVASKDGAFRSSPLLNCHRDYLKALSLAMNNNGLVIIPETEACGIIYEEAQNLAKAGRFSAISESLDVIDKLCDSHLLHRSGSLELQFAHQRFQEFFSACAFMDLFDRSLSSTEEQRTVIINMLNAPFWEDAIELVAEKFAVDSARKSHSEHLVDHTLSVDLLYASKLTGILGLGNGHSRSWHKLKDDIGVMYKHQDEEIQQYALQCMAFSRAPFFADILWEKIESDDPQICMDAYYLADGLTIKQLGPHCIERINQWSEERRLDAVWELSSQFENFEFYRAVAQDDPMTEVRAAAIQILADVYHSSDLALKAWWRAPDEVKIANSALTVVLDLWHNENKELTLELLRLANLSDKIVIGLRLKEHAGELGIVAARIVLAKECKEGNIDSSILGFLKSYDPLFLKNFVIKQIKESYKVADWMIEEYLSFSERDRDAIVSSALDKASEPKHSYINFNIASGASKLFTEKMIDEGIGLLLADESNVKVSETNRLRLHAIQQILTHVPDSFFIQGILCQAKDWNYDQASWIADILNRRTNDDGSIQSANDKNILWRPTVNDLDAVIDALKGKTNTQVVSSCQLEANLAMLAAKTDAKRYLEFIIWCLGRHIQAYSRYDAILNQRCQSRSGGKRPINPSYGLWFTEAIKRCGFEAIPKLFKIVNDPGSSHVVPECFAAILSEPWSAHYNKGRQYLGLNFENHQNRISLGKIFKQPDEAYQTVTDDVAVFISDQIDEILQKNGEHSNIGPVKQSINFSPFLILSKDLSMIPSQKGLKTLRLVLSLEGVRVYNYLNIAQNFINQGGKLPIDALKAIKSIWVHESDNNWFDSNDRYKFSQLAELHFFIEQPEEGVSQLKELLPEWVKKVNLFNVIETVKKIHTKEALSILSELLQQCEPKGQFVDCVIQSIISNPLPESSYKLLTMLKVDSFTAYSDQGISEADYKEFKDQMKRIGESIARKLKKQASLDNPFKDELLQVLESKSDSSYESLVCNTLSALDDPRGISIVLRYLDEQAYPTGGKSAAKVLLNGFRRQIPRDTDSGYYDADQQANNSLRKQLYDIASRTGPSKNRARSILMTLEEMRIQCGRPVNETRHPDIESGRPWPNLTDFQADLPGIDVMSI